MHNSNIQWTDHTFQPMDRMLTSSCGLHQLLRRSGSGQAAWPGSMGTKRHPKQDQRCVLETADEMES